jgi:hypothetical protein
MPAVDATPVDPGMCRSYELPTVAGLALVGRRLGYRGAGSLAARVAEILCAKVYPKMHSAQEAFRPLVFAEPELAEELLRFVDHLVKSGCEGVTVEVPLGPHPFLSGAAEIRPGWEIELLTYWCELHPKDAAPLIAHAVPRLVDRYLLPSEDREERALETRDGAGIVQSLWEDRVK